MLFVQGPISCDIVRYRAVGWGSVRRNRASGHQMGPIGSKTLKGHANGPPRECLMSGWSVGDPPGSIALACPETAHRSRKKALFSCCSPYVSRKWTCRHPSNLFAEKLDPPDRMGLSKVNSDYFYCGTYMCTATKVAIISDFDLFSLRCAAGRGTYVHAHVTTMHA